MMDDTNPVNVKSDNDENVIFDLRESQITLTGLTAPSQTPTIEADASETAFGQKEDTRPTPFEGTSVIKADPQPRDNEENAAAAVVDPRRTVSHHAMTTRSKSGVLYGGAISRSHKSIGKRNSLRSVRSPSIMLSHISALSETQLIHIYDTKKANQQRQLELDKYLVDTRAQQEEAVLQQSTQQEEAELKREWEKTIQMGKLREEQENRAFQQRCEEIQLKCKQEMEHLRNRRLRDIHELGNRGLREQLKLDVERSEVLAENGLTGASSITDMDHFQNKLTHVAMGPPANSNAVPVTAMPNLPTVPAPPSAQFYMPLPPLTCTATNRQSGIMANSDAAFRNSGTSVILAHSDLEICSPQNASDIASNCVNVAGLTSELPLQPPVPVHWHTLPVTSTNAIQNQPLAGQLSTNANACLETINPIIPRLSSTIVKQNTNAETSGNQFSVPVGNLCRAGSNSMPNSNPVLPAPMAGTRSSNVISHLPNHSALAYPTNEADSERTQSNATEVLRNADVVARAPDGTPVILVVHDSGPPPTEPQIFCGNSGEFWDFVDTFETLICGKVRDQKMRRQYLLQYTRGPARALVKACKLSGPMCYEDAMNLLKETYGKKLQVGHACINSVVYGPQLKVTEKDLLTTFIADIMSCDGNLKDVRYGSVPILTINQVALRLPPEWKPGWLSKVDDVLNGQHRELALGDLVDYVRKKTREISNIPSDEVNLAQRMINPNRQRDLKTYKSYFATAVEENLDACCKCPKCNAEHYLNQCPEFRRMEYIDREEFVRKMKLCFACLGEGHWLRHCQRRKPCQVLGCTRKHNALIHPPEGHWLK